MALPVLKSQRHTMQDVQEEQDQTLSWVNAHPAGEPYAPQVLGFQARIDMHLLQERTLKQKIAARVVAVYLLDQDLNTFVARLLKALPEDGAVAPELLRSHYLGDLAPFDFTRPILGEQLERMRGWLLSLNNSNNDAMKQIGSELAPKIKEADLAVQKLREAEQALNDFLNIGERQIIFNEYNELRATIYKGIEATNSGLGDAFFLHDTSQRSLSLDAQLKYTQARVERLRDSLAEEQARLEELTAKKTARDNQEQARLATLKKLADLKEQTKQLKAELKSTPKKKKR